MNDWNLEPGRLGVRQPLRRPVLRPALKRTTAAGVAAVLLACAGATAAQPGPASPPSDRHAGTQAVRPSPRSPTHAPPAARRVEPFDAAAWAALQAGVRKPAAVVFTTTDCAHCPAVIAQLAAQVRQAPPRARPELITVVMDQAPGDDDAALLADAHFSASPRLMAFAGQAPALRHAVDPAWRGVTPYVVFLAPGKPPRAVTGPPSGADLTHWLAR